MGDRASISFINGGNESIAFFSHWDGASLFTSAKRYATELATEIVDAGAPGFYPLGRLEPETVMVDFIRWYFRDWGKERIESNYYFGKHQDDGDNSDNGHYQVDLSVIYEDVKAAKEAASMKLATATKTTKPKKTAAEWKAAKEMAAKITGYGDTSPIWGKTDVTVFTEISTHLKAAQSTVDTSALDASEAIERAQVLVDELNKREAYKRLTATL